MVHHLGLALGGRPASALAQRLVMPVSNDTLLRVVGRRARRPTEKLTIIGIDDWAWGRNHRYKTIVCNLERRRIVALLPDREPATAEAWLALHPGIAVVARDRGGGYGEAAAKALPNAVEVADRWHLMENASRAFLDPVRKSMREIRSVIGATAIHPELLTCAEQIQYDGYLQREETNAAILALSKRGLPTYRQSNRLRTPNDPSRRPRRALRCIPSAAKFARALSTWLGDQWTGGFRNAANFGGVFDPRISGVDARGHRVGDASAPFGEHER